MRKVSDTKQLKIKDNGNPSYIIDYIDDPRKVKVANILAYSGYNPNDRQYGAISYAARSVDVNRMTVYEWLKDDKMLQAIKEVKAELCALAMESLRQQVKEKSFAACAFLLERLNPEQFSQQHKRMQHEKEMVKTIGDGQSAIKPVINIIKSE
jgi:hypothetical protein